VVTVDHHPHHLPVNRREKSCDVANQQ
jgi:hypothetical protein